MLIKWQKLLLVSCRAYLSLDKLTSLSGYGLSFCSVSCQNKEPYTTIQELYWVCFLLVELYLKYNLHVFTLVTPGNLLG